MFDTDIIKVIVRIILVAALAYFAYLLYNEALAQSVSHKGYGSGSYYGYQPSPAYERRRPSGRSQAAATRHYPRQYYAQQPVRRTYVQPQQAVAQPQYNTSLSAQAQPTQTAPQYHPQAYRNVASQEQHRARTTRKPQQTGISSGGSHALGRYENKQADLADGKDFHVTVGAGVATIPQYPGADDSEEFLFPYFDISYKDRLFINFWNGIGGYAYRDPNWDLGISIKGSMGRSNEDIAYLNGSGEIDPAVMLGGFADYKWILGGGAAIHAGLGFYHDISGAHEGYTTTAKLGYHTPIGERFFLRSQVSTTYASEDYMQTYFGISRFQSGRSGLAYYEADAGMRDVSFSLMGSYQWTQHWSIFGVGEYEAFIGDVEDSPIVQRGEDGQFFAAGGVAYTF